MNFIFTAPFILSANNHDGSVFVNSLLKYKTHAFIMRGYYTLIENKDFNIGKNNNNRKNNNNKYDNNNNNTNSKTYVAVCQIIGIAIIE